MVALVSLVYALMEFARPDAGLLQATVAGVIGITFYGHFREAAEPFHNPDD